MARPAKPDQQWDELFASTDFHELFRYERADVQRVYNLRIEEGNATVWVNDEANEKQTHTVAREKFTEPDQATEWLLKEKTRLEAAGWKRLRASDIPGNQ